MIAWRRRSWSSSWRLERQIDAARGCRGVAPVGVATVSSDGASTVLSAAPASITLNAIGLDRADMLADRREQERELGGLRQRRTRSAADVAPERPNRRPGRPSRRP